MARRRGRRRGGITVRVRGAEDLLRRLEELPEEVLAALLHALKGTAEATRDGTAQRVRVDTGNLRDSVGIRYDGLRAEVGWFDRQDLYALFTEFGTSSMPAQPALGPSLEEQRAQLVVRVRDEVRKALR
ncbi:HK97-gp10 family putative phage morphogenesis protein [Streptomyces sp. URMC 129]|uniref:HK97-gp10 family putative phage morphogenesis protein n=1 Tax=Streptomyces sp. URMC 129 TaxID=3423407 RepID=UPI003F1943FE